LIVPRHALFALALVLALGSFAPGARAQGKLQREVDFVRELALRMRAVGLAQEEVTRLQQTFKSAADQDRLNQLGIEISLIGAKTNPDRVQQRTLYKEALDRSKDLLERTSDPAVTQRVRATLADASQEFGQFLVEELEIARTEAPDRVKELEEEAAAVFKAGVEACDKVMADLEKDLKNAQKKLEHGLTWLRKGVLLREHARAVKADRGFLIERSKNTLEELVLEVGEETALGMRGLFEIAQGYEVTGNTKDALDSFKDTIKTIGTALDDAAAGKLDISGETQGFLFDMMQEVFAHQADVLFTAGDTAGLEKLFASFRENLVKFGEKDVEVLDVCDPRFGHLTLLAECRLLAETGESTKVQKALATAQKINERHPADFVGIKAKAVLRDILAAQQKLVSGSLLFEVAKGEFLNKNYEEAVKGVRRAMATFSPDEQKTLGAEAIDMLGRAFALSERPLESVLAYTEGLKKYGEIDKDRSGTPADNLERIVARHKQLTKNDPAFEATWQDALATAGKYSAKGPSAAAWKLANDLYGQKKFREAAATYATINDPVFLQLETAKARVAKAYQAAGDHEAARKAIADYRAWLQSKDAMLERGRTDKAQVRTLAVAEIDSAEATMAFFEAYGNEAAGLKKDMAKYPDAIAKLNAFVAGHDKDAPTYIPGMLDSLGRLHADLGEMPKAEEAYVKLKEKDAAQAARLATAIFATYMQMATQHGKELDAAIAGNKDKATIDGAHSALKSVQQKVAALGADYLKVVPGKPQLAVLVNTMNAYEALGDWKRVDEMAQASLKHYGDDQDPAVKKVIDLTVRPKTGEALLMQKQFQQAYDMLVAAEKENPTQWELKRLICRALGGWVEFDNTGRLVKVPGLDRSEEAYLKYFKEYQTWALRPEVKKFSLEWYRFQWEAYWFALGAAAKKSEYKNTADTTFRIARATDDFASLKALGADGLQLYKFFDANRPK
jgi:hypothetical protein